MKKLSTIKKMAIAIAGVILGSCNFINAQELDWSIKIGGTNSDYGSSVVVDPSGNVYTTGYFQGTADFDPGIGTFNLTSAGINDVFITKLDPAGNLIWAKKIGGTLDDRSMEIDLDASGNICITGYFTGQVDFDPGTGVFNVTSTLMSDTDIFICKMDASGNFVWAKRMGGGSNDQANSINVDGSGNIFTTGSFMGLADFDPNSGTAYLSGNAGEEIFISKLDAAGNFVWVKGITGTATDIGKSIKVDISGNIYCSGNFSGSSDFDPGSGTFNMSVTNLGSADVFVSKLDASGNFLWAKQFGGTLNDYGNSITVDSQGNVYSTGSFFGSADFDPNSGTFNLVAAGNNSDVFISKLDASGNFLWAKNVGGTSADDSRGIFTDNAGGIFLNGSFSGNADFDPGNGSFNLASIGGTDAFVLKVNTNGEFIWVAQFGGSGNQIGNSITTDINGSIYSIGNFELTTDFNPSTGAFNLTSTGATDIFVHKMYPCSNNSGVDIISACDSYTWINGITYTSSNNTATHTLTNIQGCDSTVTLDLTISNPNSGTDLISSCGDYTWIDGNTYTSSNNTATYILTNMNGCDSVVTLNLSIMSIYTSITINGSSLTADLSNANYEWVDCNNNYQPITGETNQSFTPMVSGNYAVIITENSCSDTSNCFEMTVVGLDDELLNYVSIYPNPSNDKFTVESENAIEQVAIYNMAGERMMMEMFTGTTSAELTPQLNSGVYLVKVTDTAGNLHIAQWIKL